VAYVAKFEAWGHGGAMVRPATVVLAAGHQPEPQRDRRAAGHQTGNFSERRQNQALSERAGLQARTVSRSACLAVG
jgi:hypothetical protein